MTAAVAALILLASPGAAQRPGAASPLLPPGHWAIEAAARAEALGLAPGYLPAQGAVPRSEVAAALEAASEAALHTAAAADASARSAALAAMATGWWSRFRSEFPELALLGGYAGLGAEARSGAAGPGLDEFRPDRTGAEPLGDRTQGIALGELAVGLGRWGAVYTAPVLGTSDSRLDRAEAVVGWRKIRASIGRAEVAWGTGRGGGVILSGLVPLDRIEVSTASPVRLPGWLRILGPFAFQTFAGPLPESRHPGSPWLLGGTASAKPHPRFTLSGHRALVMGGDGVDERMNAAEIFEAVIGKNVMGVNQIASTSFRLRLPTERIAPLSVYCEWGAEDSAGAPFGAPGLICGGASPSLPLLPRLALGIEHAQFGVRPLNGPPWYRHHMFPGNWAMREATLGHPLGGEGRQWLVYGEMSAMDGRLEIDGRAFSRRRTGENLYLPGREGVSRGVEGSAGWRYAPGAELHLSGSREDGDGWAESHIQIFSRILF